MRLHHLEATAFGPFADTVRVDFDALSDAGLFLLSGPTGAGKSSVLDAVCFALYGDVPGDRSTAKRLRCDQADDGIAPRVVLELTLSGRRFRLDRSPAWQRAKKRGTGVTREQARVTLSERVLEGGASTWRPLSTRLDETGHLVSRLVGMNLPQFCQVALLPQGHFQAFLRAGSDERHALLQQVFQTGRFDQVEAWLRNRRVELRRASESHQGRIADQVSRISEVSAAPVPDGWAEEPETLTSWCSLLASDTAERLVVATEALELAADAEAGARSAEEAAVALTKTLQLLHDTRARAEALDAAADEREAVRARLEAARRAAAVRPLHESAVAAEASANSSARDHDDALRELARIAGEPVEDAAGVDAIRHHTIAQAAELARVRPLDARAEELASERVILNHELATLRARAVELDGLARELPGRLTELRARVQSASSSAARVQVLRQQVTSLQKRLTAAHLVVDLESEACAAEAERLSTVAHLHTAKEDWLGIRERRLEGMAAEIASSLVVGGGCPVCGSHEHPSPAAVQDGTPDVEAERTARRLVDNLEAELAARTLHVRDTESRLAAARGAAGDDADRLVEALAQAEDALDESERHLADLPQLNDRVAQAEAGSARLTQDREGVAAELATTTSALDKLNHQHDACAAQVAAVLADTGCDDLDSLAGRHEVTLAAVMAAHSAHTKHEAASERLQQAVLDTTWAAAEAGFGSREEAIAAWLSPDEVARLEAWADAHDRATERVRDTLADPAVQAAAVADPPDLPVLEQAHAWARESSARARRAHETLSQRSSRLAGLSVELEQTLAAWAPVRTDHETVASLASFLEGKSPDNRLQMRLSAYVLAHRLSQVVEAANLRLHTMSDQRYSLQHTGQRGAGDKRGGLSLMVRDDWSGESRDPATLSGGETFVVSLALALGLADVITAEAGGADLDTLFVDEGFGSLDAETLDDVMDTLDSLRDGGRVVGVVSHVAEMQVRIPTQLRVVKARHGSRLSQ